MARKPAKKKATKKKKTVRKKPKKKKTARRAAKKSTKKPAKPKPRRAVKAHDGTKGRAKAAGRGRRAARGAKRKKLLFTPGDFVVYPTHGVGKVTSIEIQEIAGHKLKLFVISFDRDRMTLRVPVTKADTSGLRRLSSRRMMDTAMETLKGRARVKRTMWSRRAQEYEAKINSGDPIAIAEVVRDLHRNVGQPDQSFSERQIYESARDRLAYEVAAVERIDIETATEKLEQLLKAA
jgi:CarD family transcriptional regulator